MKDGKPGRIWEKHATVGMSCGEEKGRGWIGELEGSQVAGPGE